MSISSINAPRSVTESPTGSAPAAAALEAYNPSGSQSAQGWNYNGVSEDPSLATGYYATEAQATAAWDAANPAYAADFAPAAPANVAAPLFSNPTANAALDGTSAVPIIGTVAGGVGADVTAALPAPIVNVNGAAAGTGNDSNTQPTGIVENAAGTFTQTVAGLLPGVNPSYFINAAGQYVFDPNSGSGDSQGGGATLTAAEAAAQALDPNSYATTGSGTSPAVPAPTAPPAAPPTSTGTSTTTGSLMSTLLPSLLSALQTSGATGASSGSSGTVPGDIGALNAASPVVTGSPASTSTSGPSNVEVFGIIGAIGVAGLVFWLWHRHHEKGAGPPSAGAPK